MANEEKEKKSLNYLCKYQVPTLIFMLEDKRIEMDPTNILSIEKSDDFEFYVRSIIKVSLRMDARKKLWLLKNKSKIVCKFELDKIAVDVDVERIISKPNIVWNEEFSIFFNDEIETMDLKNFEERLAMNESNTSSINDIKSENYFETQNTLDVYLFNRKLLNASSVTYNEVFTKDILQQMVARLLTDTNHPNVLMSPFENNEVYSELVVPPHQAYEALIYLDQYYGFYKYGAVIFYDADILYIINPNGKMDCKRDDEWPETNILIKGIDQSIPGDGMKRVYGEDKFYCNIPESLVNAQKFTIGNNAAVGSEAKIVITDQISIDIEDADQSYMDQRNQFFRFVTSDDNKYTSQIVKARMEENECIFFITADNWDLSAFTPNKEFKLIFEEASKQKAYGKYRWRLAYAYHYIYLESQGWMNATHRIVLKKCAGCEVQDVSDA